MKTIKHPFNSNVVLVKTASAKPFLNKELHIMVPCDVPVGGPREPGATLQGYTHVGARRDDTCVMIRNLTIQVHNRNLCILHPPDVEGKHPTSS